MPANHYHFVSRWRVQGTVAEVAEVIGDAEGLPRWWPSVYLEVRVLDPGDEGGVGRVVDLYTRGWLPYTLRWRFQVTEQRADGFTLKAWGDFNGYGVWTFEQDGPWTNVTYDWDIVADKPLLRYLSPLAKPIFEANHRWAMARGEASLRLELARRHARTPEQLALIPPPPARTTLPLGPVAWATAGVGLLVFLLRRRHTR